MRQGASAYRGALKRQSGIFAEPHAGIIPLKRRSASCWKACAARTALLSRWRKAPPRPQSALVATIEGRKPDRTRGADDRIAELQLENSRLRRLVLARIRGLCARGIGASAASAIMNASIASP